MQRPSISKRKLSSTSQRPATKLPSKTIMPTIERVASTDIPIERKKAMTNLCASRKKECEEELGVHLNTTNSKHSIEHVSEANTRKSIKNNLKLSSKGLTRIDFHKKFGLNSLNDDHLSKEQYLSTTNQLKPIAKPSNTLGMKGVQSLCVPSKKSMPYLKTNTSSCLNNIRIGNYNQQKSTTQTLSKTAINLKRQHSKSGDTNGKIINKEAMTTTTTTTRQIRTKLITEETIAVKECTLMASPAAAPADGPQQQQQQQQQIKSELKLIKSDADISNNLQVETRTSVQKTTMKTGARKRSATATSKWESSSRTNTTTAAARLAAGGKFSKTVKVQPKVASATSTAATGMGRTFKILTSTKRTYTIKNKISTGITSNNHNNNTGNNNGSKTVNLQIVNATIQQQQQPPQQQQQQQQQRLEGGGLQTPQANSQRSLSIKANFSSSTIDTGEPSSDFLNSLWLSDSVSIDSYPAISSISMLSQSTTSDPSLIGYRNPLYRQSSSTSNEIFSNKNPKLELIESKVKIGLKEQQQQQQQQQLQQQQQQQQISIKPNSTSSSKPQIRKLNKSKTYLESLIPPNDQDVAKYNKMKIQQRRAAIWREWVKKQSQQQISNQNLKE